MSSSSEDEMFKSTFDPMEMLYNKKFKKPDGLCVFDNLATLEGYLKRTDHNLEEVFDKTKRPPQTSKKISYGKGEIIERRFKEHQKMIHVGPKIRARDQRTVITFMEEATGPYSQLSLWMKERVRVKVLIRKSHGIRGHLTGFIRLFDRHWNLVLTEVEEQFKRRKFRYGTELALDTANEQQALNRFKQLGLAPPKMDVKSLANKKFVLVKKSHKFLFIKGDQVAVVHKCQ